MPHDVTRSRGAAEGSAHTWAKPGRPWAVALLALLLLPTSPGAAGLGRVLRQANFQEKAGCLHARAPDVRYETIGHMALIMWGHFITAE